MKKTSIASVLFLAGCITIEAPGIVSDTVKATRDVYKEATAKKAAPAATPPRRVLAHSYVGSDSETVAQIKQVCVNEAAQKLERMGGKEQRYSVYKNEVVTLNNNAVANCELAFED